MSQTAKVLAYRKTRTPVAVSMPEATARGWLHEVMDAEGHMVIPQLIEDLGTTASDLAATVGLPRDAISKTARQSSPRTQSRLREAAEVLNLLCVLAGSLPLAYAYYRAQPLPALGGRTAEALVKDGHASLVRDYLDHIQQGGYA